MNPIPKRLKNEPLIEVIRKVQFEPTKGTPVGDIFPGILFSALRKQHRNLQLIRLSSANIPTQMAQLDPNLRHMEPEY